MPPEYLEISLDIEAPLHEINRLRARDFIVFLRANNFSELGPDTSLKCKFEIGKWCFSFYLCREITISPVSILKNYDDQMG